MDNIFMRYNKICILYTCTINALMENWSLSFYTFYMKLNISWIKENKQGPQEPQKLSSLKSREFDMKPSEMAFLSNSKCQNRKERTNQTTNNGGMDEKAKRLWVSNWKI